MSKYLNIVHIIISILLIIVILLQSRGAGLGALFGGDGNIYKTKRGAEKTIFIATIILAIAFLGLSLANLLISK